MRPMQIKDLLEELIFSPLILFAILGLMLFYRYRGRRDLSYRIGVLGIAACIVLTSLPLLLLVSFPLKSMIAPNSDEKAGIIVVPGASASKLGAPSAASAERAYMAVSLYQSGRASRLLFTGFSKYDSLGGAKSMKIIARGFNVPDENILISSGETTYHEAVLGKALLANLEIRKIILVTSWSHMPRSVAVWEKQGFEVTSHVRLPPADWARPFSWGHMVAIQRLGHEYAGMFVYWLRGWI